jgi:NADH-quinone oxidoreductase subunit F
VYRILDALETGTGTASDVDLLSAHTGLLAFGHTFCALAPGAADPLKSALQHFREDFDLHVTGRGCPYAMAASV